MNKAADPIAAALGQTIAGRGADYYRSGKILSVQQQSDGAWLAQVAGSKRQVYRVQLRFGADGAIRQALCDCPYDALCKHIAAVWYAVSSGEPPELPQEPALKKAAKPRAAAPKMGSAQAQALLDEARALFRRYARGCDYRQSGDLGDAVWTLLEDADVLFDDDAFGFHQTVYQRLNKIIQHSDDSDGILGDAVFHCIEMSNTVYQQAEPKLRAKIEKFWQSILADSDEHWIAFDETAVLWQAALCESGRADAVLAWLDAQYARLKRDGYERERLILRKYEVLGFIDAAQAEKWLQDHLSIPEMRRIAVDQLMAQQQWAQAERLLVQGLEKAQARHQQGVANEWRALLLEVATQTGQQQAAREYAAALAFGGYAFDENYYQRWRALIPAQDWPDALAQQEIKLQQNHFRIDVLAQLYVLENCTQKLYGLLQRTDQAHLLEQYIDRLDEAQQNSAALHWLELIVAEADVLSERKKYAEWVKKLNRLYDRFAVVREPMAVQMETARQVYAKRPAMLQEMLRLKAVK